MRINTQESIDTAKAARDHYGSWADAKEAKRREGTGAGAAGSK
jgi:hypothetical protein